MAKGIEVRQSFTLNVPADVAFAFWRRFSEFPRFMKNVESVTELDDKRSHWVVRGPGGRTVEWDAEIVEEIPGKSIHWRTIGEPPDLHDPGLPSRGVRLVRDEREDLVARSTDDGALLQVDHPEPPGWCASLEWYSSLEIA